MDILIKPPGQWQTSLLTAAESLSRKEQHTRHEQQYTRSELKVTHGVAEATRMIAAGKFEQGEDSDGDEIFYKRTKSSTGTSTREQQMSFNRIVLCGNVRTQKSLHNKYLATNLLHNCYVRLM